MRKQFPYALDKFRSASPCLKLQKITLNINQHYEESIDKFIKSSSKSRLEKKEPFVKFYWLFDSNSKIVGTIRYRINIPIYYGNIGYEICPKHRQQGLGKKMLNLFLNNLKQNGVNSVIATVRKSNLSSIKLLESNNATLEGNVSMEGKEESLLKFVLKF